MTCAASIFVAFNAFKLQNCDQGLVPNLTAFSANPVFSLSNCDLLTLMVSLKRIIGQWLR